MLDTYTGRGRVHDMMIRAVGNGLDGTIVHRDGIFLTTHQPHEILLQVRDHRVTASLDGEEQVRWSADWSLIEQSEPTFFPESLGGRPIFGVGACCSDVTFHSVELREVAED